MILLTPDLREKLLANGRQRDVDTKGRACLTIKSLVFDFIDKIFEREADLSGGCQTFPKFHAITVGWATSPPGVAAWG